MKVSFLLFAVAVLHKAAMVKSLQCDSLENSFKECTSSLAACEDCYEDIIWSYHDSCADVARYICFEHYYCPCDNCTDELHALLECEYQDAAFGACSGSLDCDSQIDPAPPLNESEVTPHLNDTASQNLNDTVIQGPSSGDSGSNVGVIVGSITAIAVAGVVVAAVVFQKRSHQIEPVELGTPEPADGPVVDVGPEKDFDENEII